MTKEEDKDFLYSIKDKLNEFIRDSIQERLYELTSKGQKTIYVNFKDLIAFDSRFGDFIQFNYETFDSMFNKMLDIDGFKLVPRIINFSGDGVIKSNMLRIKDIRTQHLEKVYQFSGLIRRTSDVKANVVSTNFECSSCGNIVEKNYLKEGILSRPSLCKCGGKHFAVLEEITQDIQTIDLDENPEEIEMTEQPKRIKLIIRNDLCSNNLDAHKTPGSKVDVVGIVRAKDFSNSPNKTSKKTFYIEVISLKSVDLRKEDDKITDEDIAKIFELSKNDKLFSILSENIAPTLKGISEIKLATLLQLVGGVEKYGADGSVVRGLIHILLCTNPGCGKCLGKGTKVLMYDGSIKNVEDITINDRLMGDDSKERNVLSTTKGVGKLYKIKNTKGEYYIVNEDHILSLSLNKKLYDMSLKDFIKLNKTKKERSKGYRVGVEFGHKDIFIDPYFLGIWLGDGTSVIPEITTPDSEIVEFLSLYSNYLNLRITKYNLINNKASKYSLVNQKGKKNILLEYLRYYNLINNKHIPNEFKCNSRENRLKLLAGLVDSDGFNNKNCIDFVFKDEKLSNDIVYLCRSLGFHASIKKCIKTIKSINFKGEYFRIIVSGNLEEIPTKIKRKQFNKRKQIKDVKVYGINIEYIGLGDYYGFSIDGNRRFLLGDFTVTHNTMLANAIRSLIPRARYVSGASATGVGLTASIVIEEDKTRALEAGALVLANGSMCILDEVDKLGKDDAGRINEAMESLRVTISKAGIFATLQAKTSILLLANPKYSRFDKSMPLPSQIDIEKTIISRCDLILPMFGGTDDDITKFIIDDFKLNTSFNLIDRNLLRKYLSYAKELKPEIKDDYLKEKIFKFFKKYSSKARGDESSPIQIEYRQLLSLKRLAEASAKIRLSNEVEEQDIDRAFGLYHFMMEQLGLNNEGIFDVDMLYTTSPSEKRNKIKVMLNILNLITNGDKSVVFSKSLLKEKIRELASTITDTEIEKLIVDLKRDGSLLEPRNEMYRCL